MKNYAFKDMVLGLSEQFVVAITAEMMNMFQQVSGDVNPLHSDESYAQAKGCPGRVVYGMLSSSLYSTLAGVHLPGKSCLLQGIDITFHNPAFIGDTLTVKGEVSYLNEAYGMIEIRASIKNQGGKTISKAKIKAGFS